MQFPEKIVSIKPGDKVLDIGPGGNPHPKATVYLELNLSEQELAAQRGYAKKPQLTGEVIYYDGKRFPFKDNEFDYVICSHVIEHVVDVKNFAKEMFRVGKRGYLEYPTIYYEYLYNFDVHINFLKSDPKTKTIYFLPKSKTPLNYFKPVQDFLYTTLTMGYDSFVVNLKDIMFEGFEWRKPYRVVEATNPSLLNVSSKYIPEKNVSTADSRLRKVLSKAKKLIKNRG